MSDVVEFAICGGELYIEKKVFVREMLKARSPLKRLLNYEIKDEGKERSLKVDKSSPDRVILDFNFVDNVPVGGDYQNILEDLKKAYKGTVKGEVTLSAFYYHMLTLKLDLNSEDDQITVISG